MSLYVRKYRTRGAIPERRIYGYLYNWYVTDRIAADGWRVGTNDDWDLLIDYLGGVSIAGGKLKSLRTDPENHPRWSTPNTSASNEVGFNVLPGGYKFTPFNIFTGAGFQSYHVSNPFVIYRLQWESAEIEKLTTGIAQNLGLSLRLTRNATPTEISEIPEGQTGHIFYTGNDGKVYDCVRINDLIWTAENLIETKYNDGTDIPEITDNTAWGNDTTGARCSYDNNEQLWAIQPAKAGKPILRNGKALQTYSRGKYTIEEIDAMIDDGFIPVASKSELYELQTSGLKIMGLGSKWQGLYFTGLDRNYVLIQIIKESDFDDWPETGTFTGIFEYNDLRQP